MPKKLKAKVKAKVKSKAKLSGPKIKKVVLKKDEVLHVEVPRDAVPIVVPTVVPGVVRVIPVPETKVKDQTFWQRWFG